MTPGSTTLGSGATRALAEFVATRSLGSEAAALRAAGSRILADTLACIVAGAGSEIAPGLLRYARQCGPGATPVMGTALTLDAGSAALLNGAFGHALEYDDVFSMMPGHPAVVMLATLLGDVAARPTTSQQLVDAFIIGYEVCGRFGMAMSLEHHRVRGFHATGTLGLMGAAAALARLRGADTERTARILSVAASFASGLLGQIGSSMKPMHAGWAARSALAAADLVECGIEGGNDLLESPKGFFVAYGTAASQVERLLQGIADPWVIVRPGVSLKKYPCCFAAHRGIEALLRLVREHGVRFEEVARIECRLPPKGLVNMVHHRPRTGLQAKFSMEYCFVSTLMDGEPGLLAFTDPQVQRTAVQAALGMVDCVEDKACEEGLGEASGEVSGARGHVQITLTLRSGASLTQRVAHAPGTPMQPLTPEELNAKFRICGQHAGFSSEQVSGMQAALGTIQRADATPVNLSPFLGKF